MADLVQLRRIVRCLDGRRVPLNREERATMPGDVPYWGSGGVLDSVNRSLFAEELVLLGEDGAPFFLPGRDVAYVVNGSTWVNNHIHVLRPVGVHASFLRHCLNVTDYGRYITGSTRDKLTQGDMLSIEVPLPKESEQRRIAEFLDGERVKLDNLIAALRVSQSRLGDHSSAVLDECVFGPGSGRRTRLKYLFEARWSGSWGDDPLGDESDITCVRIADFRRSKFRAGLNSSTRRSLLGESSSRRFLRSGDVLLEKSGGGPRNPVGFAATFDGTDRSVCSNFIVALRPAVEVDRRFAGMVLAAHYLRRNNVPFIRQSTGIQNLDVGGYLSQGYQIPACAEQGRRARRFEASLEVASAAATMVERQMSRLSERFDAIVAAAVTGQLDVTTARGVEV